MRKLNISNSKKRSIVVNFTQKPQKKGVKYVLPDGGEKKTKKILKTTSEYEVANLLTKYGSIEEIGNAIIESDIEVDIEKVGSFIDKTKKIYVDNRYQVQYGVDFYEIKYSKDGEELSRKFYEKNESNIKIDIPLKWTNRYIPKEKAIKKFVFERKYQIVHKDNLTYDFLYELAQELDRKKSLMLMGAGESGKEPLIFQDGGKPYKAFLEGRVSGDRYCLIIHLTAMELKEIL